MFGSFGAGFGAFGSGTGGLLPTITNLTSWIRGTTQDGKTLPNSKGTDANLTGVNCINSDQDDADNIDAQLTSSPTGDWYIEMTVYPQSFVFYGELVGDSTTAINIYLRFHSTTGRLATRINNVSYETSSSNAIPLNEWSRVVCERSGSNVIFSAYELDGTERFSETISAESTAMPNKPLVFFGKSTGRHFNGLVSDIKVGNSSTDLLCHYPLAEGSGTKAYDVSGKGNHGTITGTSWSTQDGIASWNHEYGQIPSVTFDGTDDYIASGVTATDNFSFEFKARLSTDADYMGSFVGVRFFTGRNNSTSVRLGYKTFNGIATVDSTIFDKLTTYKIEGGKLYIDGVETIDSGVSPANNSIGDLYIGARNFSGSADSFVNGDVAYFKVWNASGALVRHFVPTTDGFIDLVNHTAYTNDGAGTLTTKRIPALNTKTTQVATFDGVNDKVVTGVTAPTSTTVNLDITAKFIMPTVGSAGMGVVGNGTFGNSFGIMCTGQKVIVGLRGSSGAKSFESSTITAGTVVTARLQYDSSLTNGFLGTVNSESGTDADSITGNISDGDTIEIGSSEGCLSAYSGFFNGKILSVSYTQDGVEKFNYDFQNNIGTTTVLDTSASGNNGTVTNTTLANFWGARVADTAGSIVGADYAVGNTSISNPSGYTHNNSECGFDMVTNDKTVKQLFTIDNSTATQTFARKNNSFITQVLDYSSAVTGDELTRTRKYVGS